MSSHWGNRFRINTWGESHGPAVGVVIEGCPPGLQIDEAMIQRELDRRRPGVILGTSPRDEKDRVQILSGVHNHLTLGTPIALIVWNQDARPSDYQEMQTVYRPGHADFTYKKKYGVQMPSGGGRASARETIGRVAAGAIALELLKSKLGIEIISYVERIHAVSIQELDFHSLSRELVDGNPLRVPDLAASKKMQKIIQDSQSEGDSLGGVIATYVKNVPAGLGEPVFDKIEADLAKAMLSIPSVKGFEIGNGFSSTFLKGSENNDEMEWRNGEVNFKTNRAGGSLGGITTGAPLYFRVAFKPPSTIMKPQSTASRDGKNVVFSGSGRMDSCVLPRAVPIVDAMTALVLADHYLMNQFFVK